MRHYNGPSTWVGGHRWVHSLDNYDWEWHDKPPLWGVRRGERFMNGVPVDPYNPMLAMLDAPMPEQKILMTEAQYKAWMEDLGE
jgi:hypothetical protein